jgi:hypothetical protein
MPGAEERDKMVNPEVAGAPQPMASPVSPQVPPQVPGQAEGEQRVYLLKCNEKITVKSLGAILNMMGVQFPEKAKQLLAMMEGVSFRDITDEVKAELEMRRKIRESQIQGFMRRHPVSEGAQTPQPPQDSPIPQSEPETPQPEAPQSEVHLDSPMPRVG